MFPLYFYSSFDPVYFGRFSFCFWSRTPTTVCSRWTQWEKKTGVLTVIWQTEDSAVRVWLNLAYKHKQHCRGALNLKNRKICHLWSAESLLETAGERDVDTTKVKSLCHEGSLKVVNTEVMNFSEMMDTVPLRHSFIPYIYMLDGDLRGLFLDTIFLASTCLHCCKEFQCVCYMVLNVQLPQRT